MAIDGTVLFEKTDILQGQDVYQRYGLMDHGSVWGHGSQRGMEFSATTLHLLSEEVRSYFALQNYNRAYDGLEKLLKQLIDLKVIETLKTNRYNAQTDTLTLSAAQAHALKKIGTFWKRGEKG